MNPKPSRWTTGRLLLMAILFVVGMVAFAPLVPCPRKCWQNDQLMGYAKLPGVSRDQIAQIHAWADSYPCDTCHRWRRISLLQYCWSELFAAQRCS